MCWPAVTRSTLTEMKDEDLLRMVALDLKAAMEE